MQSRRPRLLRNPRALALASRRSTSKPKVLVEAAYALPARVAGTAAGNRRFRPHQGGSVRRAILGVVFVVGVALVV